jgi:hypothetical protein
MMPVTTLVHKQLHTDLDGSDGGGIVVLLYMSIKLLQPEMYSCRLSVTIGLISQVSVLSTLIRVCAAHHCISSSSL